MCWHTVNKYTATFCKLDQFSTQFCVISIHRHQLPTIHMASLHHAHRIYRVQALFGLAPVLIYKTSISFCFSALVYPLGGEILHLNFSPLQVF